MLIIRQEENHYHTNGAFASQQRTAKYLRSQYKYLLIKVSTMHKAQWVRGGRIITASEAAHKHYKGIFKCPECNTELQLRKCEFSRKSYFAHKPHKGINCKLRADSRYSSELNFIEEKGQNYELLKRNLIRSIRDQGGVSIFRYCRKSNAVREIAELLVDISNSILKLSQNQDYINNSDKVIRKIILERGLALDKEIPLELLAEYPSLHIPSELNSEEDIDQEKVNQIVWCIEFLAYSNDDKFRKKVMEYILGIRILERYMFDCSAKAFLFYKTFRITHGKYDFKKHLPRYCNESNTFYLIHGVYDFGICLKEYQRRSIKLMNSRFINKEGILSQYFNFDEQELKSAKDVFCNESLISNFYFYLYEKPDDSMNFDQELFEKAKKFHNALFEWLFEYFAKFKWQNLLEENIPDEDVFISRLYF